MKTIRHGFVFILALLLLVGIPVSVRSADAKSPLTMITAKEYASGEPNKFMITFSENVKDPRDTPKTMPNAHIVIYREDTEEPYYYSWDNQNQVPSLISSTATAQCGSMAQWSITTIGHRGNATGTKLMGDIGGLNYFQIQSLYRKIVAQDSQVRLVVRFTDAEGTTPDGYIDAIESLDQSKKLQADSVHLGVDCAELELVRHNTITGVDLYDGQLMIHFSQPMKRSLGSATFTLGLYNENGICTEVSPWPVSAANLRYYGEDKTTLCVDFAAYDQLKATLEEHDGYELGFMVQSKTDDIDGVISDVVSLDGYSLVSNTSYNGKDAFYQSAVIREDARLMITDAKLHGDNQVLITFNQPIVSTVEHYVGLSIYNSKTGGAMMAYKRNDTDTGYVLETIQNVGGSAVADKGDGVTEYKRAQWTCSSAFQSYNGKDNQVLVSVSGDFDQILNIIGDTDVDLRIRIQEKTGAGAANGMVDTIWSVQDPSNKLISSVHDDALDQAWCSVSGGLDCGASIGETKYGALEEALRAAVAGDMIVLAGYTKVNMVMLPNGVSLDLNGHFLVADYFFGFGQVIDSTEGQGALVVSRDRSLACIHLQVDNAMFPIYDATVGGYRFFAYSLTSVGTKIDPDDANRVKYGVKLAFDSIQAYELLADEANADVSLIMDLSIGNRAFVYKFTHNIFNTLYQTVKSNDFANRSNYAITLTVSGLKNLSDNDAIVATPAFYSAQKVNSIGKTIRYEGTYDSYTRAKAWIVEQIENDSLFSFTYDGAAYADHMNQNNWTKTQAQTDTGWMVSYTHKKDNVVVWSEITFDPEMASVEWTNYFRNEGTDKSPIISDIRAIDSAVQVENPVLTSANGSTAEATDFQSYSVDLTQTPNYVGKMKSTGGRSSEGAFPYFDISNGKYGIMGAIGWTGNWNADFVNQDGQIVIDAGMQKVSTYLEKGEQMRTPMIMIQFFKGDQDAGHNALRKLILKNYTPADASGKPIEYAMLSVGVVNAAGQGEETILNIAKNLESAGSKYECLWIDAGWYGDSAGDKNLSDGTWSNQVGNWYFIQDNDAYPNGNISNLSQYLNNQNKDLLLWFEPERVRYNTELYNENYSYLLRKTYGSNSQYDFIYGDSYKKPTFLFNFADDNACDFMINKISSIISENNLTWYRQDFNMDPEEYWSYTDKQQSNRTGMTEIKYVTNLYRYLDALVEQNPGLMIDNCASGGRRLDLEMMKRSVPLWNSDYGNKQPNEETGDIGSTPDGIRAVNYNLSWWLPIHAGSWPNRNSEDITYSFRVDMNSGMQLDSSRVLNATVKGLIDQYFTCREWMNGDYYILASGKDAGIETEDACYEFYKAKEGKGYLVAFRPENCNTESATYYLKGLNAAATYEIEMVDSGEVFAMTGEELMVDGLPIQYSRANMSLLIYITEK